jgi:pheromone shutdown protein TraB
MAMIFISALAIGAGLIAGWVEFRFSKLAPEDMSQILMHVLFSSLVTRFLFPQLMDVTLSRGLIYVAIFGVALPLLVYCMLVGFWTLRFLSGKMAQHMHR